MKKLNLYYFNWNLAYKLFGITSLLFFFLFFFVDSIEIYLSLLSSYLLILGLYFDWRIKNNRKILIIFLLFFLWIISIYLDKIPYLIIKDLFWYSLIINGSFIFHLLILSWIYRICWLNRWEYSCFLISRISFIFSLSFIIYIIRRIALRIYLFNKRKLYNKSFGLRILYYMLNILLCILREFTLMFHKYSLVIMGINYNNNYWDFVSNIKRLEFIFFTFFVAISIGYPRLYLIWIFYFFNKIYNVITDHYNSYLNKNKINNTTFFSIKNYIVYLFEYKDDCDTISILIYDNLEKKQMEQWTLWEKPYYNLFVFDFIKFLFRNGEYIGCDDGLCEIPELLLSEFPIKTPFKFYPWVKMMQQYYLIYDIVYEYNDCSIPSDKYHWRSIEERYKNLMEMCEDINLDKKQYNLITNELPENLNKEIVKKQENFYLDLETNNFKLKEYAKV